MTSDPCLAMGGTGPVSWGCSGPARFPPAVWAAPAHSFKPSLIHQFVLFPRGARFRNPVRQGLGHSSSAFAGDPRLIRALVLVLQLICQVTSGK